MANPRLTLETTDTAGEKILNPGLSEKLPATTTDSPQTPFEDVSPGHQFDSNPWWPSLYRIRPLSGIAALLVSMVCITSSLGVLLGSRGKPVDAWYFKPTVLLAIATAISNTALNCALAQAAPISFWYKACKGSTIRDLELEWEAGTMFPRAIVRGFRQGRYFNLLTISSLVVALVVIDGPLLQRASSMHSATISSPVVQNVSLATELPAGFSGVWYVDTVLKISKATAEVGKQFAEGAKLRSAVPCDGSCAMKVRAPGITTSQCSTKHWPITRPMLKDPSSSWGSRYHGSTSSKPFMFVGFFLFTPGMPMVNNAGPEQVVLNIGRTELRGFEGSYIETNCTLRSAILEYDILLEDHDITFASPPSASEAIREAETFVDTTQTEPQPLRWAGLASYLSIYTSANATFADLPAGQTTFPVGTSLNALVMRHVEQIGADREGNLIVSDPTDEVLNSLNELMFRGALLAGPAEYGEDHPGRNQSVQALQTLTVDVFDAELGWFAGAAVIQIVAILLILPVLWGWWELGLVDLTLSPFHVAKLFDAPLLQDVHSTAGAVGIMRGIGDMPIKLGEVATGRGNQRYGSDGKSGVQFRELCSSRLGIAEAHQVAAPYKGMRFTQ